MPIHTSFAVHTKNQALAALVNTWNSLTNNGKKEVTAEEFDSKSLVVSGEYSRRLALKGSMLEYQKYLRYLLNTDALKKEQFEVLSSGERMNAVQTFFSTNPITLQSWPLIAFIRYKQRLQLKRVELLICHGNAVPMEVGVFWLDQ